MIGGQVGEEERCRLKRTRKICDSEAESESDTGMVAVVESVWNAWSHDWVGGRQCVEGMRDQRGR